MARTTADRLKGVHPELAARMEKVLAAMALLGHPMLITEGVRSLKRQQQLFAQGRTKPGKIVTYADGLWKKSNHQAKSDGFGYAVDCCFLIDIDGDGPDDPSWAETHPWALYGEMAKALGLEWGGDWQKLVDRPHVEMTRPKGVV